MNRQAPATVKLMHKGRRKERWLLHATPLLCLLQPQPSNSFSLTSHHHLTSSPCHHSPQHKPVTATATATAAKASPNNGNEGPLAESSSIYFSDEYEDGELCWISDDDDDDDQACAPRDAPRNNNHAPSQASSDPSPLLSNLALRYIPVLMPVLAYSTYEPTARSFDSLVELISNNNWVAVDGGAYQSSIITPAINGLVVPSMSLLFATLIANTINTLRQRQLQIRTSLNIEANDLRMISVMLDSMPSELRSTKNHLRRYLVQYATRVISECSPGLSFDNQKLMGSIDSEINGFLRVLTSMGVAQYSTMYVDTMLPAAGYGVDDERFRGAEAELGVAARQRRIGAAFLPPHVLGEVYDALTRLRHERSVRLSALQSTYPPLHYVILSLLGCSICLAFLMETNQNVLIFLTAIQLRILWAMLIGTFSSLAVVNYDMIDPFRGSYNVAVSVNQFYTIREAIKSIIRMDRGDETDEPNGGTRKVSEDKIIDSFTNKPPVDGMLWL